jgi:hypothetical protein
MCVSCHYFCIVHDGIERQASMGSRNVGTNTLRVYLQLHISQPPKARSEIIDNTRGDLDGFA